MVLFSRATPAAAQESLQSEYRLTGEAFLQVFEPLREALQRGSAVIEHKRKRIAYGVVASADGLVATKASEIEGKSPLVVTIDRTVYTEVEVLSCDQVWDVALLKVKAQGLHPLPVASKEPQPGQWVVVNGASSRRARRALAGVISAPIRPLPALGGVILGTVLERHQHGLLVKEVTAGSGAEKAGIATGDIIQVVDGTIIKTIEELTQALEGHLPGSFIELSVLRGQDTLELEVTLAARGELLHEENRNDAMSGRFSRRRSGFPRVLQHSVLGNAQSMGGPVLNLAGELVGMNIARANRAETFAIPAADWVACLSALQQGLGHEQSPD